MSQYLHTTPTIQSYHTVFQRSAITFVNTGEPFWLTHALNTYQIICNMRRVSNPKRKARTATLKRRMSIRLSAKHTRQLSKPNSKVA